HPYPTALRAPRRIRLSQDLRYLWASKPFWQPPAFIQILLAYLSAGNTDGPHGRRRGGGFYIPSFSRNVYQLNKRDYTHPDIILILRHQFLSLIRVIERSPLMIGPWTGMVAADDQMVSAVVSPDQGMPQRFTRTGKPHG